MAKNRQQWLMAILHKPLKKASTKVAAVIDETEIVATDENPTCHRRIR